MKNILGFLLASACILTGAAVDEIALDNIVQSTAVIENNENANIAAVTSTDILIVDTAGIYDGMTMSYDSGYTPEISNNTIQIILPLIINPSSGVTELIGNTIKITPNLGSATNTPFVFEGVHMQSINITGKLTGSNDAKEPTPYYLLNLPVKLKQNHADGEYAVNLSIDYQVVGQDTPQTQEISFPVVVSGKSTDSIGADAPESTDSLLPQEENSGDGGGFVSSVGGGGTAGGGGGDSSASTSKARLMLEEYYLSSDPVVAGEEFELTAKIKNTSTKAAMKNLIITFSGESADIVPSGNSNSKFIKTIKANSSESITIPMKVRGEAEAKPQKVTIAIVGEDKDGTEIEETMDVLVDIKQPDRIEFDEPSIAESINAGDTVPITLKVMNKGRGTLNNVTCKLDTPGLFAEGSAFLGNMESGTSKDAELMVFVGTRDMSSAKANDGTTESDTQNMEKYGPVDGKLIITYEDSFGKEFTEEIAIKTTINEPMIDIPEEVEEPEPERASQWWVSVLIGAAAILGISFVTIKMRKKRMDRITMEDEAI